MVLQPSRFWRKQAIPARNRQTSWWVCAGTAHLLPPPSSSPTHLLFSGWSGKRGQHAHEAQIIMQHNAQQPWILYHSENGSAIWRQRWSCSSRWEIYYAPEIITDALFIYILYIYMYILYIYIYIYIYIVFFTVEIAHSHCRRSGKHEKRKANRTEILLFSDNCFWF